ncbi:MAG: hypothetical protein ACR2G6_15515 [Gemmatimonadaceae bacterium]
MTLPRPQQAILADALLPNSRRGDDSMGMPHATHDWTAALVQAIPDDGNRYEVIDGELFVTPAPAFKHQFAVGDL